MYTCIIYTCIHDCIIYTCIYMYIHMCNNQKSIALMTIYPSTHCKHQHTTTISLSSTDQPFVPGMNDCVQHRLIEEAVAHPLGDDDIDFLHWEIDFFDFAFD